MDSEAPGRPLSEKQLRFVAEYLIDLNATQAAIRAGYAEGSADVTGCRLLADARVLGEITRGKADCKARNHMTADAVLEELRILAKSDIGNVITGGDGRTIEVRNLDELAPEVRRCIESVTEKQTQHGSTITVKLHSKIAALQMLFDHFGLSAPKQVAHSGGLELVSAKAKLAAKMDEIKQRAGIGTKPSGDAG